MQASSKRRACYRRFLYLVLSAISLSGKLPWNLKTYTVYRCRSHFRESRSLDCDISIIEALTQTRAQMECMFESFSANANLKFLAMWTWLQMQDAGQDAGKTFWNLHNNSATHRSGDGHQRGADAQILRPHQSADFDHPHPHPQVDAIFFPCTQWFIYLQQSLQFKHT